MLTKFVDYMYRNVIQSYLASIDEQRRVNQVQQERKYLQLVDAHRPCAPPEN